MVTSILDAKGTLRHWGLILSRHPVEKSWFEISAEMGHLWLEDCGSWSTDLVESPDFALEQAMRLQWASIIMWNVQFDRFLRSHSVEIFKIYNHRNHPTHLVPFQIDC